MLDYDVNPCPNCGATNASKINFSWWGGALGPRLMNHVKCGSCGTAYNGKTGNYNTANIIIYFVIASAIALVVFFALYGGSI